MTPTPRPQEPALETWRAFLVAHARVTRQLEHELQAEQGMSLADYDVLVQLAFSAEDRLRMSELAERLLLSRSGVTRLIDRLQAQGLVDRVSCEDDRRGQWAMLTETGRERLRKAAPTHLRGVGEHFLQRIPADELHQLRSTLERLSG